MSNEEDEKDKGLTVVKKIKDGNEVIEVKEEDAQRINENLMKMQALGLATANIDREYFGASTTFDPGALACIFKDLYDETYDTLCKYGLCL